MTKLSAGVADTGFDAESWCCVWCGKRYAVQKGRHVRKRTCSPECGTLHKEEIIRQRTTCHLCGSKKKYSYTKGCSPECIRSLKSLNGIPKSGAFNLCMYTAPDEYDYLNMLEILHRKGYAKASTTKEKWTYTTEGYPTIKWVDIVARGVVLPRTPRPRKEQQGHEDGVQQEAEASCASAHPEQEL